MVLIFENKSKFLNLSYKFRIQSFKFKVSRFGYADFQFRFQNFKIYLPLVADRWFKIASLSENLELETWNFEIKAENVKAENLTALA